MSDAHADLAALADGSLPPGRRAEVETLASGSAEAAAALARQHAALDALRATEEVEAPARLRGWLRALGPATGAEGGPPDELGVGADEREAGGPVHIRGRRATQQRGAFAPPPWRAGSAASAGTRVAPSRRRPLFRPGFIALVFVLLAGGGGAAYVVLTREDDDPRTDDLVALAERPADESAADLRPRDGRVSLAVDGIAVPDWRRDKGWRAVGARRDKLRDHDAATVFYERRGDRVALTIAERPALERPADAETVRGPRRSFLSASLRGRETLVWYRGGRTLVLSSADVPRQTLLKLVS